MITTRNELVNHFPELGFSITKKGNGINVYLNLSNIRDEYDMETELKKLYHYNAVPLRHRIVIGFRELDSIESTVTEVKWVKQIRELFE